MTVDLSSPHILFNSRENLAEPDWSLFCKLEVMPVQENQGACSQIENLESLMDDRVSFWTIYGRLRTGEMEAITDIEHPQNVTKVAKRLHAFSGLPLENHPALLVAESSNRANEILQEIKKSELDTTGLSSDKEAFKQVKDLKHKLGSLMAELDEIDYNLRYKSGKPIHEAYICPSCGSEEIVVDAYAEWNSFANDFELHSTYTDTMVCNECSQTFSGSDAETRITQLAAQ